MSPRRVTAADVAHGERSATLADFRAHAPSNTFIYMPCREPWTAPAVDVVVGRQIVLDNSGKPVRNKKGELVTEAASDWLLKHQRVEQMAWIPGAPALIHDRLIVNGGIIERPEVTCLNMYRPPQIKLGDPNLAAPWVNHVCRVFPSDADHVLRWLAQRVQLPEIKINHALLLGSETFGIGKDTLLAPVRYAVSDSPPPQSLRLQSLSQHRSQKWMLENQRCPTDHLREERAFRECRKSRGCEVSRGAFQLVTVSPWPGSDSGRQWSFTTFSIDQNCCIRARAFLETTNNINYLA